MKRGPQILSINIQNLRNLIFIHINVNKNRKRQLNTKQGFRLQITYYIINKATHGYIYLGVSQSLQTCLFPEPSSLQLNKGEGHLTFHINQNF